MNTGDQQPEVPATCGVGSYTFDVIVGALPNGLVLIESQALGEPAFGKLLNSRLCGKED